MHLHLMQPAGIGTFFFIGKKEFGDCWNSFDVGIQFSNVMEDSQRQLRVRYITQEDVPDIKSLLKVCQPVNMALNKANNPDGFPQNKQKSRLKRGPLLERHQPSSEDGIMLLGSHIVIPKVLRDQNIGHRGTGRPKRYPRNTANCLRLNLLSPETSVVDIFNHKFGSTLGFSHGLAGISVSNTSHTFTPFIQSSLLRRRQ